MRTTGGQRLCLLLLLCTAVAISGQRPIASLPGSSRQLPTAARTLNIGRLRNGSYDVVEVPLEEYVARVLAGEAAARSAPAALEALAIAVRTFAVANLARHKSDSFDLCDQTHCQVMATATPVTRGAAAATSGEILTYGGQPAAIFYTACCGGQSELPSDVWPRAQDQPFLKRHTDRECGRLPEWTAEIDTPDLLRALRAAGFEGDAIRTVKVERRSDSGRAAVLKIEGLEPEEITGDELRAAIGRTLGWQLVRSTAFDVRRISDVYSFTGRGYGHGVGMCVVGAARMAADGASAAKILDEYFPGTKIAMLPVAPATEPEVPAPGDERVPRPAPFPSPSPRRVEGSSPPAAALPSSARPAPPAPRSADEVRILVVPPLPDRQASKVAKIARQALGEITRRAMVPLPESVQLVFHPDLDGYTAQTKLPWWTAGATSGDRIDLLPLSLLEERRILDRTIRHEVAHVLTARALDGRRVWVREGAAIYLSGERVEPPVTRARDGRIPCPTDAELLRSQSPASLHDAYTRAAACYAAQIAAGRRWDEVR